MRAIRACTHPPTPLFPRELPIHPAFPLRLISITYFRCKPRSPSASRKPASPLSSSCVSFLLPLFTVASTAPSVRRCVYRRPCEGRFREQLTRTRSLFMQKVSEGAEER